MNVIANIKKFLIGSIDKKHDGKNVPNPTNDPYLRKWNNRKKPKVFFVEKSKLPFKTEYDFSRIRAFDFGMEGCRISYFIDGQNRNVATRDILSLNSVLREEHKNNPEMPLFQIRADKIRFSSKDEMTGSDDYSRLFLEPLTPTGKLPKYPMLLRFKTLSNDESFRGLKDVWGDIFYNQNGEIGKIFIRLSLKSNIWIVKRTFSSK